MAFPDPNSAKSEEKCFWSSFFSQPKKWHLQTLIQRDLRRKIFSPKMYLFTFFSVSLTSQHAKVSASLKYKYVGKIMILDPACWKNKKYVGSRRSHKKWTLVRLKTNYRSSGRPVHHRFSDIG